MRSAIQFLVLLVFPSDCETLEEESVDEPAPEIVGVQQASKVPETQQWVLGVAGLLAVNEHSLKIRPQGFTHHTSSIAHPLHAWEMSHVSLNIIQYSNVSFYSKLLTDSTRLGQVDLTLKVFDQMPKGLLTIWVTIIWSALKMGILSCLLQMLENWW